MKLWTILLVCCHLQIIFANDICITAVSLSTSPKVCDSPFTTINFSSNFASTTPTNTCKDPVPPDLWLHLNVPASPNVSYMIRRREGTTIDARAEVLYHTGCPQGSACCEVGGTLIGCFDFDIFPNAIVLQNPAPGDYYIRVWDDNGANSGTFNVSAHTLALDINDWVICDDTSGEGTGFRANQLMIEPSTGFNIGNYDPGFKIVDSCICADPPLLLFEAADFDIFLDGRITAKNDPDVEGSGFNYKMEFRRLPFSNSCRALASCSPLESYNPEKGSPLARVAIIDSGINADHQGFENGHWTNDLANDPSECLPVTNVGYDFKNNSLDPQDSLGHGSWVAGTIIEDFPTDIGLELMSLKFYSGNDDFLFDAICAMHYAIDQGASTLVTSWGFRSKEYPELLANILQKSHEENTLICASAGNLGNDNDDPVIGKYPANAPVENIISVTAFDESTSAVSSYANVGASTVDLAAIDYVVAPTSVLNGTQLADRDSVVGTSISAPRVARTAAIIKATYPILSAAEIKKCILETAIVSAGLGGFVATSGTLDHDAAIICAKEKAEEIACVTEAIIVNGTLINDVSYKTTGRILNAATIESSATVTLESPQEIKIDSSALVKNGAELIVTTENCFN